MRHESESRKAWLRFRRNTAAFLSLCFIGLSVIIALFAYALAPDNTTDANTHIPEIALQTPGFRVNLLGIPSSLNFAVMGSVILIGVLADQQLSRRRAD